MIEKKDWETALLQCKAMKVNDMVSKQLQDNSFEDKLKSYDNNIEFIKKKIAGFPEDDPMPEDLKEDIKDVKK